MVLVISPQQKQIIEPTLLSACGVALVLSQLLVEQALDHIALSPGALENLGLLVS